MNFSEKWGKDIKTATDLALKELKASIDEVKVTVVEEPSKGFLGIGSKLALVRVEKLDNAEKSENEVYEPVEAVENIEEFKVEKLVEPEIDEDEIVYDGRKLNRLEGHAALEFLSETTEKMGIKLSFEAFGDKENLYVKISGRDSGTIIGKRGQTLDAIQYLTSLVVNKNSDGYVRVVLDAENYRKKREKTLEALANRLADKVVRNKRSVKLEPMNPYERMIIHSTLQKNDRVTTKSEGEEPYRRIIIELK